MSFITIILFFVYTWGFGYTVTKFLKNPENFLERNLMRIGIGLGVIPILGVIFGAFGISIDWRIFFALSMALPVYFLIKNTLQGKKPELKFALTKSDLTILIVLLLFGFTLFMYTTGAFKYSWFEDDDPWSHAVGVKFVAFEKKISEPQGQDLLYYIDPYPPGYDMLMGILHQTSPLLNWTMKFFNALIVSLGIIFFYFLVKRFTGNSNRALFSTFVLAAIPCYLSHFIWAHSLAMTLLIVALYCLVMIEFDMNWIYATIVVIASICVTQPTKSIKFFFLFMIYFVIKSIYLKKFQLKEFSAIFGGYFLSIFWWATRWKEMFFAGESLSGSTSSAMTENAILRLWHMIQRAFPYDGGTATRPYTFSDFFVAKSQNMINNPVGVGIVISLLVLLALVAILLSYSSMKKEKKMWIVTVSFWLIFTFLGVNSMTFHLPVGLFAFRFWMVFALPVSILASEGLWFLYGIGDNFKVPKFVILISIIVGVFFTAGIQKYAVNTAMWGPGQAFGTYEEVMGFAGIASLPENTKIFGFCPYGSIEKIIGFNQYECGWCPEVPEMQRLVMNKTADSIYSWTKQRKYEYTVIDGLCVQTFGINDTNRKLQDLISSGKFQPVQQGAGFVLLKIL